MLLRSWFWTLAFGWDDPPPDVTYGLKPGQEIPEKVYGRYDVFLGVDCYQDERKYCVDTCMERCAKYAEWFTTIDECLDELPIGCRVLFSGLSAEDASPKPLNNIQWPYDTSSLETAVKLELWPKRDLLLMNNVSYDHTYLATFAEDTSHACIASTNNHLSLVGPSEEHPLKLGNILRVTDETVRSMSLNLWPFYRESWESWLKNGFWFPLARSFKDWWIPASQWDSHVQLSLESVDGECLGGISNLGHRLVYQWHLHAEGRHDDKWQGEWGNPIPRADLTCTNYGSCAECDRDDECTWCMTALGQICARECVGEAVAPLSCFTSAKFTSFVWGALLTSSLWVIY